MQSVDLPAVQSLHYQIVPPLLHPVEPAPNRVIGFVHSENMKCYASVTSGMYGIVLTPLIHPDEHNVSEKISALGGKPARSPRTKSIFKCALISNMA